MSGPSRRLASERLPSLPLPDDLPSTAGSASSRASAMRILGHISPTIRILFAGALVGGLLLIAWSADWSACEGPDCTRSLSASLTSPFSNPFKSKAPRPPELAIFEDNPKCPLRYDRLAYEDIKAFRARPYVLGGLQQPTCKNCHSDWLFAHFCKYESHGPVCPDEDIRRLQQQMIDWAEEGMLAAKQMLLFTPCDLFPWIKGRTLWLVGDSIQQEMMKAAQCFYMEFWDLDMRGLESLTPDRGVIEKLHGGWCVELPEDTKICHLRANLGDWLVDWLYPALPALGAQPSDIMVLNIAVWLNLEEHYNYHLGRFAEYYRENKARLPVHIWRDSSPQHFNTPTGDFKCDNCPDAPYPFVCEPIQHVRLEAPGVLVADEGVEAAEKVARGGWRNIMSNPLMAKLGVPVLHTWNYSVPIWNLHHHYQANNDCTHSCHPSAYQLWMFEVFKVLREVWKTPARLPPTTKDQNCTDRADTCSTRQPAAELGKI